MNYLKYILLKLIIISYNLNSCDCQQSITNDRPIIGILQEETTYFFQKVYKAKYQSAIAASYVKFVERSGGRVFPIPINQTEEYYEAILSKLNGVLFPGGAVLFNHTSGYSDAGKIIYNIAKKINDNGTYFPLWGTCLGFELLAFLSSNGTDPRVDCSSNNQALNLEFKPDFSNSRLFGNASEKIINIFKKENVTANFHKFCLTEDSMKKVNLDKEWKVLSVNRDWNNLEFISSFEHVKYPFYGVQFHPEKNIYEWVKNKNISHTSNSILASQYLANFFIDESRKNNNHFKNSTEEKLSLIYNYIPEYTGLKGSAFEQSYLFPKQNNSNKNLISNSILLLILNIFFLM